MPASIVPVIRPSAAVEDAVRWHDGQKRKDGVTPYVTHPIRVMERLADYGIRDPEILAAAVLHDVLEDCPLITMATITEFHGATVAMLVDHLTKVKEPKWTRQSYLDSFRGKDPRACLIKMVDRADNLRDWNGMDRTFRPTYATEGLRILVACLENRRARPTDQAFVIAWKNAVAELLTACKEGLES